MKRGEITDAQNIKDHYHIESDGEEKISKASLFIRDHFISKSLYEAQFYDESREILQLIFSRFNQISLHHKAKFLSLLTKIEMKLSLVNELELIQDLIEEHHS